jgi:hypothetical protein
MSAVKDKAIESNKRLMVVMVTRRWLSSEHTCKMPGAIGVIRIASAPIMNPTLCHGAKGAEPIFIPAFYLEVPVKSTVMFGLGVRTSREVSNLELER